MQRVQGTYLTHTENIHETKPTDSPLLLYLSRLNVANLTLRTGWKNIIREETCEARFRCFVAGVHLGVDEAPRETLTRPIPLCCACELGRCETEGA